MHAILWCSKSCDYNRDEYDKMKFFVLMKEPLLWEYGTRYSTDAAQQSWLLSKSPTDLCKGFRCSKNQLFYLSYLRASENTVAESERTLHSSSGVWEHLGVGWSTGEVAQSVWEVCVLRPNWYTFCWWKHPWSKLRCACNGRCSKRNCIYLNTSLVYNVLKICEWSSIQPLSPSPKSSLEQSICRVSADWCYSILRLSNPPLRCWPINIFIDRLHDWAGWMSCADYNGSHGCHCSEFLGCVLCNPIAWTYAFPHEFSTLTTSLWALVIVGSVVEVG